MPQGLTHNKIGTTTRVDLSSSIKNATLDIQKNLLESIKNITMDHANSCLQGSSLEQMKHNGKIIETKNLIGNFIDDGPLTSILLETAGFKEIGQVRYSHHVKANYDASALSQLSTINSMLKDLGLALEIEKNSDEPKLTIEKQQQLENTGRKIEEKSKKLLERIQKNTKEYEDSNFAVKIVKLGQELLDAFLQIPDDNQAKNRIEDIAVDHTSRLAASISDISPDVISRQLSNISEIRRNDFLSECDYRALLSDLPEFLLSDSGANDHSSSPVVDHIRKKSNSIGTQTSADNIDNTEQNNDKGTDEPDTKKADTPASNTTIFFGGDTYNITNIIVSDSKNNETPLAPTNKTEKKTTEPEIILDETPIPQEINVDLLPEPEPITVSTIEPETISDPIVEPEPIATIVVQNYSPWRNASQDPLHPYASNVRVPIPVNSTAIANEKNIEPSDTTSDIVRDFTQVKSVPTPLAKNITEIATSTDIKIEPSTSQNLTSQVTPNRSGMILAQNYSTFRNANVDATHPFASARYVPIPVNSSAHLLLEPVSTEKEVNLANPVKEISTSETNEASTSGTNEASTSETNEASTSETNEASTSETNEVSTNEASKTITTDNYYPWRNNTNTSKNSNHPYTHKHNVPEPENRKALNQANLGININFNVKDKIVLEPKLNFAKKENANIDSDYNKLVIKDDLSSENKTQIEQPEPKIIAQNYFRSRNANVKLEHPYAQNREVPIPSTRQIIVDNENSDDDKKDN